MKKFSKVKYFGAVAAALLAVAPIAAPVVSQVASPAVAQAATTQIDTAAQDLVNSTFKSTVNTTFTGSNAASATNVAGINSAVSFSALNASGSIAARFIASADSKWGQDPFSSYQVSINLDGNAAGATGANLANILNTNPQKTYTATVNVYKANSSTVIATKTIVVNNANYASVSFPAINVNVGDDAYKTINVADAASALKVTTADGVSVNVYPSDFDSTDLWYATSDQVPGWGYVPSAVQEFISNPDSDASTTYHHFTPTSDSKFIKNGVVYQVFKLGESNSALYNTLYAVASANGEVNTTDGWAKVASKGGVASYNGSVFVVRPVNISTGDSDVAYQPVFNYNYSSATATTAARVDTYRDGQTVQLNGTDASSLYANPANTGASAAQTYDTLTTNLQTIINGSLIARENSFLDNNGHQAAQVQIPEATADIRAAVAAAIPNVYKTGTYTVPVTVTNARGYKATVKIPVQIGVEVGTPVARVFPVNTTITKGDKFDRYADVSFQNSDSDATLIPNANISVSGTVDTTTPGNYTLTYTVTNPAGVTGTFVRTVTVVEGSLTESTADGVVYINKADGAVLYTDAATTKATSTTLDNTTAWKFHSVVKDSAGKIVAYNLGGKQYVKAGEVSTSPVKAQAGVFTVHYPANAKWSIAVYNSDLKVVKLVPANSTWATFGTKTLKDGKSYYNLGGNQWVRTDYGFWNAK